MQARLWKVGALSMAAILMVAGEAAAQRESGIQRTPDNARVLVSKDVGGERYAITLNTADGTVTGNVFSTNGSAPQFISCDPTGPNAFSCSVAGTCDPSAGRESGIQRAFSSEAVLVSKDVQGQRYAITQNLDGTLTGNVFFSATGAAKFLFCTPQGEGYTCAVADSCTTQPCTSQYATLPGIITLPATFFTLPDGCTPYGLPIAITLPKNFFVPDPEIMSEASRQVIDNNPFRNSRITKVGTIDDLILATRTVSAASSTGDRVQCPTSGFQELEQCEIFSTDSGPASVSTIGFKGCTSGSSSTGFLVQSGTLRITIPSSTKCILLTTQELPIGKEILEERLEFQISAFDGAGVRTETDVENIIQFITHLRVCAGVDTRFASNLRRSLIGTIQIGLVPDDVGDEVFLTQTYDDVTLLREYSDDCGTRMTTIASGQIATIDGRFGESYATRFDDLQYALSGTNDDTSLAIDGGLVEECSGSDRSFAYRTITPASFDRNGDGCPRGGAFELSAEGVVVGQLSFTDVGGVTLTPVSGTPMTFASCNDTALILRTCAANN